MLTETASRGAVTRDGRQNKKSNLFAEAYEWVGIFSFVIAVFVLLFSFVVRDVCVYGDSMLDTLHVGDRLIISNINYKPKDGDVIVMYARKLHKPIVKRVIAVGGQTVYIDYVAHRVFVDGELQSEPYIKDPTAFVGEPPIVWMPVTVPKDRVFVMGDNRNNSEDSRSGEVGMISSKYILGKALICYFPVKDAKIIN